MDFELRAPRCLARSLSSPMEQDDADETEPTGETVAPDDDAPATEAEPSDLKRTHDEAGVKETVNPDRNDWLCAACIQFKAPFETPENPGVLLMCDGPCRRSWHTDCLEVDMPESDEWFCPDCSDNTHPCSFCGDTASEGNAVSKCSVSGCRFFFHVNCVLENPQAFQGLAAGAEQGGGGGYGGGGAEHSLSFRCRGHVCETCFDVPGVATKSKRSLVKCQLCPTAWHPQCVPPSTRFTREVAFCERHQDVALPASEEEEEEEDDGGGAAADGATPAAPRAGLSAEQLAERDLSRIIGRLFVPKVAPPAAKKAHEYHYRLNVAIKREIEAQPPKFQHISANRYVSKPARGEATAACECVGACGEDCLNRLLRIECCGGGDAADGGGGGGGGGGGSARANRFANCRVGPGCGNRRISQRKAPVRLQPFREGGMGWGLKTLEPIEAGRLVTEYHGEVVDQAELDARMEEHSRRRPGDLNHYVMELDDGHYLDARHLGSLSRYVNHSCAPNCELQKWNVAGFTRIGIFACADVPAGAALSYDYRFSTCERVRFRCACGAKKCRGTLALSGLDADEKLDGAGGGKRGKKGAAEPKLSRHEKAKIVKQLRANEARKAVVAAQAAAGAWRARSLTGRCLPGDAQQEIRAGPPIKYQSFARERRLYLWRNVTLGSDFIRRRAHLLRRHVAARGGVEA